MMSKTNGLVPMTPAADHSEKEGYFVQGTGGKATVCSNVADKPIGVIVDGEADPGLDTIAILGATSGTLQVKLGGAATKGSHGELMADGTVQDDDGSGARVLVCVFLESGSIGELVEAAPITPIVIAA